MEENVLLGELRNLEQGEAKREPSRTDTGAMRRGALLLPPAEKTYHFGSMVLTPPLPPSPFHLPAARPTFHRNDTTLP